jgi:hypothetical protein
VKADHSPASTADIRNDVSFALYGFIAKCLDTGTAFLTLIPAIYQESVAFCASDRTAESVLTV